MSKRNAMVISVVIPTRNEAARLPDTLAAIARNQAQHEVIVVDARSDDATASIAARRGAHVIASAWVHRARQMNLGAQQARGGALLFLHADTLIPRVAFAKIGGALGDARVAGGAFARRYDSRSWFLRATCLLAEARQRAGGWFLGDQAMFVRSDVFEKLGGFREMDLFEDLDFARRMKREGRTVTLRPPVISSARRFESRGPVARTLADFLLTMRHLRGDDLSRSGSRKNTHTYEIGEGTGSL